MARAAERRKGRKPGKPARASGPAPSARAASQSAEPQLAVVGFELGELRRLIRLVQRTGIGELELSSNGRSVRISATPSAAGSAVAAAPAIAANAPRPAAAPAEPRPAAETGADHKVITSPMVGTFYRAPAPDADPFVEVDDVVEVGQTVCIIEAMKLMNEIEADHKGRVVQILVDNAQAVEFGQRLFLLEPL